MITMTPSLAGALGSSVPYSPCVKEGFRLARGAVGVMHIFRRRAWVGRPMRMGRIRGRHGPESMKPGGVRRASVDRSVEV